MKRLGLDPAMVEKVYFNEEISGRLYAVFNRDTPLRLVARCKDAFEEVHGDGRYDAIRRIWLDIDRS